MLIKKRKPVSIFSKFTWAADDTNFDIRLEVKVPKNQEDILKLPSVAREKYTDVLRKDFSLKNITTKRIFSRRSMVRRP